MTSQMLSASPYQRRGKIQINQQWKKVAEKVDLEKKLIFEIIGAAITNSFVNEIIVLLVPMYIDDINV